MPAQALYRKWRPQLWDEVVGQEAVVQTLRNALRGDRVAHAYLFSGPRGCGKTTSARLVAKALNCLHPDPAQRPDNTCAHCLAVNEGRFLDLIEIDGASNNGVENIRDLRDKINFSPNEGRYKVYVIDECHMLSTGAFNALLKTLEEPPAHAVFILATTENYKIPATVSSRCQRFEFRRIPVSETVARLKSMCAQEQLEVDEAALEIIARQATGSLRDAISLLDQLLSADNHVTLAQAQELLGTAAGQTVQALADTLAAHNTTAALNLLNTAIDAGADPRQLARQIVDYLRGLLLVRLGNAALVEATAETRALMARQAQTWETPALLRAVRAFTSAANDVKGGWQPQLPLELALVECATPMVAAPSVTAAPMPVSPAPAPAPAPGRTPAPPAAAPARAATRPARAASAKSAPAPVTNLSATAPAGLTLAEVQTAWIATLQLLLQRGKLSKLTLADLDQCVLQNLEGHLVTFTTENKVFIEKISARPDVLELMSATLSETLGFKCAIKFNPGSARAAEADIPPDGMVAAALDLGGQLVEE